MRTNVNIADDAREFAALYAHANGISLGEAITDLIRKGQQASTIGSTVPKFEKSSAGFPLFPKLGRVITTEMVREAEEDELG
jgi:hypothetical protein